LAGSLRMASMTSSTLRAQNDDKSQSGGAGTKHGGAAFKAPLRGGVRKKCQNVAITFGMEKPEWCSYRTVKKVSEYI